MTRYLCTLLSFLIIFNLSAQLSIDNAGTTYSIDFDGTVSGVNLGPYGGSGFNPSPSSGELDGDAWEINGLSDGDHLFGQTNNTGDFARGNSSGSETTGGLFAFDVSGTGDFAFGFQPTGSDLNPGEVILKIDNNTGSFIVNLDISYEIWEYNDQNRDTDLSFSWSYTNSNWNTISSLDYTTPAGQSGGTWNLGDTKSTSIGVLVPNGSSIYLLWETVDGGAGSGSRDELALDDIQVTADVKNDPLVISEIMADPAFDENGNTLSDNDGEWFEVYNNTNYNIEMGGLIIEENGGSHIISSSTVINPGEYFTFGSESDPSLNGAYTCKYDYSNIGLNNGGDHLRLDYPDGIIIDEVDFTTWTVPTGSSIYFNSPNPALNNNSAYWSTSTSRELTYQGSNPSSDYGSPGTSGSGQLLPLWITEFNGRYHNHQIELAWRVEQTDGIEKFEVEISQNGGQYEKIGEIKSVKGQYRYQFTEHKSLNKVAYVRLKQIDKSGAFFYSVIITLDPEFANHFNLFPNPASDQISIQTEEDISNSIFQIRDLSGRLVKIGKLEGKTIDLGTLPSGVYHLRLSENQTLFNKTFLKQ